MTNFISTVKNIFRIEELRQRLGFTLMALIAVRIGSFIALPGINAAALKAGGENTGFLGLADMFVGGAFSNAAIFSLGVMPYITASIILQIAGVVLPQIQKIQRDGEDGRRKINQYTRVLAVLVAVFQGIGALNNIAGKGGAVVDPSFMWYVTSILILVAGTMTLMWIGEQITDRGIGNGVSMVIFIGIIARFPQALRQEFEYVMADPQLLVRDALIFAALLGIIAVVVLVTQGARRIPVQYARRVVGRKQMGGQTQYIPLRVNAAGVMPIIFAQSILFIPATLAQLFPSISWLSGIATAINERSGWYALANGLMILFFTYFYTAIAVNPRQMADDMKKNGGFIPGVRPGTATADYIENIITRITLPGAIFLAIIAILPTFAMSIANVPQSFASFIGGTSLLIVVGVALDTLQQIESYLLARHYDGFMKTGKIAGRAGTNTQMSSSRI